MRFLRGVDLFGHFGLRAGRKVLGRENFTLVLTFLTRVPCVPLTTFFCTFCAFWTALAGAFFTFSSSAFFSATFLGAGLATFATFLGGIPMVEVNQAILAWPI